MKKLFKSILLLFICFNCTSDNIDETLKNESLLSKSFEYETVSHTIINKEKFYFESRELLYSFQSEWFEDLYFQYQSGSGSVVITKDEVDAIRKRYLLNYEDLSDEEKQDLDDKASRLLLLY